MYRIRLVPFDNRIFGPYLAAIHRLLISVMWAVLLHLSESSSKRAHDVQRPSAQIVDSHGRAPSLK
jgi:hypothetical protein